MKLKRLSILMSLVMVFTLLSTGLTFAQELPNGYVEQGKMAYGYVEGVLSPWGTKSIDIMMNVNGEWVTVTHIRDGFRAFVKTAGADPSLAAPVKQNGNKEPEAEIGIELKVSSVSVNSGTGIKLNYEVTSTSPSAIKFDLGVSAAVGLHGDDSAKITDTAGNGFEMTAKTGTVLSVITKNDPNVTDVSDYWYGDYQRQNSFRANAFKNYDDRDNSLQPYKGVIGWSWQNIELQPEETKTMSIVIGEKLTNEVVMTEVGSDATGSGNYTKDNVVNINAGTKAGFEFVEWTASPNVIFKDKTSAITSFDMPDNMVTLKANWKLINASVGGGGGGGATTTSVDSPDIKVNGKIANERKLELKSGDKLELDTSQKKGIIYYTTDGSKPNKNSKVYDGPIVVTENMTLKFIEIGEKESAVVTKEITVTGESKLPEVIIPQMGTEKVKFKPEASTTRYMVGLNDQEFGADKPVTRLRILESLDNLLMFTNENPQPSNLTDVPEKDRALVGKFQDAGIVTGKGNGTFGMNDNLTKAEFGVIICNILGIEPSKTGVAFKDTQGHWANEYMMALKERGYLVGDENENGRPDDYMTAAEFTAMINQIIKTDKTSLGANPSGSEYNDTKDHWAEDEINAAII